MPRGISTSILFCAAAALQAAPQSYRLTGTFSDAEGTLEALSGKSFVYDLTYDPAESGSSFSFPGLSQTDYRETSSYLTAGGATFGNNAYATSYNDDQVSSLTFSGSDDTAFPDFFSFDLGYRFGPEAGHLALPTDLIAYNADHAGTVDFFESTANGEAPIRVGSASGRVTSVQAVPEPASLAALGAGALALLRRRRRA